MCFSGTEAGCERWSPAGQGWSAEPGPDETRLHDHAVQSALVTKRELEAITTEATGRKELALQAIHSTITQLRHAIFELQPLTLEQGGLEPAIHELADHHARVGHVRVRVAFDPDAAGAHDQLAYSLMRELLSNAVRHARANAITVSVERRDQHIRIEVADDGTGIPAGRLERAAKEGHIGLAATIDRVAALDGTVKIDSAPHSGTTVRADIPTRRAADLLPDGNSRPFNLERWRTPRATPSQPVRVSA